MIHHTPIATSAFPPSVPRWLKSNQVHNYCMDKPRISYPLHHTGPLTFSQNSKSCACVCLTHFAGWQIMTFMPFFSNSKFSASLTKESKNQKNLPDTNQLSNARNTTILNRNSYSELMPCVHTYSCMTGLYLINAFSEVSAKAAEYFYSKSIQKWHLTRNNSTER